MRLRPRKDQLTLLHVPMKHIRSRWNDLLRCIVRVLWFIIPPPGLSPAWVLWPAVLLVAPVPAFGCSHCRGVVSGLPAVSTAWDEVLLFAGVEGTARLAAPLGKALIEPPYYIQGQQITEKGPEPSIKKRQNI